MAEEKIRLGGMALPNGVLVHGPTSWACAVRLQDGGLTVATGAKRFRAAKIERPLLRGPARIAELFALLPHVRRHVPEAKLPFERREVLAGVVFSAAAVRLVRASKLGPVAQECLSGLLSITPAVLALRSSELAAYHGAEHVSIGTYEHGAQREKEHERCGGHLVGPLLATNAIGGALASRAPERWRSPARAAATVGALAASTEIFVWMTKNPEHRLSKVLGRPGHELQHRLSTAEPSAAQLEVAEAALQACLALEHAAEATGNETTRAERLPPEVFDLPVEKMRAGYYTDAYFNHARATLRAEGRRPRVTMQVFQKRHAYLGGMDEALAILRLCAEDWDGLHVEALYDGDRIEPWETVLTIEGEYTSFAHLETLYLGVLARRTLITTNVVRVLEAARGKPVIFMPARHDHHRIQTGDGYAAFVAGRLLGVPVGVTTDEQASWWGGKGVGTVPHSLIAAYGGDTVLAAQKFAAWAPGDLNVTVLVDFENDSVRTALEVARALGPRLWGVRLDTSESLVDRSLWEELGDFGPTGVNARLVRKVREALDGAGFEEVRIVASGGFDVRKIGEFEEQGVPVDAYGVGSSLIRGANDFTADVVVTDGRPSAKVGRRLRPNPRLEPVV